jgi:predicted membrane protein
LFLFFVVFLIVVVVCFFLVFYSFFSFFIVVGVLFFSLLFFLNIFSCTSTDLNSSYEYIFILFANNCKKWREKMPNKDGTGPLGEGPKTGRGKGACKTEVTKEMVDLNQEDMGQRGLRNQEGRGCRGEGRGFGRRCRF